MKSILLFLAVILGLSLTNSSSVLAKSRNRDQTNPTRQPRVQQPQQGSSQTDSDLIRAIQDRRQVRFLEAGELIVSKVLPDDTNGLPHQRWYVTTSEGTEVFCVYNLHMGQRIPLKVGDKVAVGGEFKWTSQGALVHWLHEDPKKRRPDGYVEHKGIFYGL